MDAAIYLRISHDPAGQAAGVRRQEDECKALAKDRGINVVATFRDNNVPATKRAKRVGWQALLDGLEAGRFDSVIAWANDRMYRSTEVRLEIMRAVQQAGGRIVTVKDGEIDPTSAAGRMTMGVLGEVAAFERERASERQVARWKQRKQDGKLVTLGRRPFGLRRQGDKMVEVKKEADAIRRAARKLIRGASLYSVVKELPPTPFGNSWHPQHFRRALLSDHLVRYGVLDEATHKLVAARLKTQPKKGPGRPRREYAMSGLVICSKCGSKLAASAGAFHCQNIRCGKVGIKSDLLDAFVLDELSRRVKDEDLIDEGPEPDEEQAPLLRELAEIEDRIAALADNIDLSEAVLARRTRALETKRDELTQRLGRPLPRTDSARWLAEWAAEGFPEPTLPTDEESRAMYRELIGRVVVRPAPKRRWTPPGERVEIVWRD